MLMIRKVSLIFVSLSTTGSDSTNLYPVMKMSSISIIVNRNIVSKFILGKHILHLKTLSCINILMLKDVIIVRIRQNTIGVANSPNVAHGLLFFRI